MGNVCTFCPAISHKSLNTSVYVINWFSFHKKSEKCINFNADTTKFETFEMKAQEVESIVGDEGLNVLINNAGIHMQITSVNDITTENLISQYLTNTVGPIMLTKVKLM